MSSSQPSMRVPKRTHRVCAELTEFAAELNEKQGLITLGNPQNPWKGSGGFCAKLVPCISKQIFFPAVFPRNLVFSESLKKSKENNENDKGSSLSGTPKVLGLEGKTHKKQAKLKKRRKRRRVGGSGQVILSYSGGRLAQAALFSPWPRLLSLRNFVFARDPPLSFRFGKRGLLERGLFFSEKKKHLLEILENLVILTTLENPQTVENKGESDHFLEILENLEISLLTFSSLN